MTAISRPRSRGLLHRLRRWIQDGRLRRLLDEWLATWSSPKTMGSEVGTSSDWNTYVRDNELYLYGIAQGTTFSAVQVRRAASQAITTATETAISFDTENLDFGGWWSSGTTVTVPAGAIPSGYTTIGILLLGSVKWASNGTGSRRIILQKNGSEINRLSLSGISGEVTINQIMELTTVAAGDTLLLVCEQTSGGNLNVTEARYSVLRVGPAT